MSDLRYYSYPGVGEQNREAFSYSQAVRLGDTIQISGQGGWDPTDSVSSIPPSASDQITQAFKNVDLCLKHAGGKGWSQVYRVNSYHVPLDDEALEVMARHFKEWMPGHQPLWTCIGVVKLGEAKMKVEIEVVAYDPEGAKVAGG